MDLIQQYENLLLKSVLLSGVAKEDLRDVLLYLSAEIKNLEKNEVIVGIGEEIKPGIILQGHSKVFVYDEDMNYIVAREVPSGMFFGLSSACLNGIKSEVDWKATTPVTLLNINISPFINYSIGNEVPHFHQIICHNIMMRLAEDANSNFFHLRVIGQQKIRNRLKTYLSSLYEKDKSLITIPFSMSDLSLFLGTDRSILYKEINALKREGILDWNGRNVRILDHSFLMSEEGF